MLKNLIQDESGAVILEYGLLVALIALVCIAGVSVLGSNLSALFSAIAGSV
jgi:pilus assembly protein Flp/PilA